MSAWQSVNDNPPPVGCKFVALYDDGSGARMFFRHDGGYIDGDGDELSNLSGTYDLWTELPDGFQFWCETRSEDPMTLSSSKGK